MHRLGLVVSLLLTLPALAGCLTPGAQTPTPAGAEAALPAGFAAWPADDRPVLDAPLLIDDVRAGGEPVIAILPSGTILVASHPGPTHYHPSEDPMHPGAELVTPMSAQSYLWRSADGGKSWTHIGLPGFEQGPRSAALGISDPEFTVMADGTACYTDLEALASSSVACSTDDGKTWLLGNPVASGGPNDRQWLASYQDELYFTANYFTDHRILASTDQGLTWERRGDVPCSQDLVANPETGALYVGCGAGIAVSLDGGRTWSEPRKVADAEEGQRVMAEPGIDSAGNVWVTWATGESGLWLAGTPDEGESWPWVYDLSEHFAAFAQRETGETSTGTYVWPWLSAGSEGRVAVSWIGAYDAAESATFEGDWFVFTAFVRDASSATPAVLVTEFSQGAMHRGPICQSGTVCQVSSMQGEDSGDRRLGDFFETTIDAEGNLHGVWSNTLERPDDVISHVQYARMNGGFSLLSDEDRGSWTPTQG